MQQNTREDYFHRKTKKLEEQVENIQINSISSLFNGMIFYINGMTDPPPFKLQQLIKQYGGKYCISRFQKFTHVISTSLSKSSINGYRGYIVLRPEWLIDSIESNKAMDIREYQLNIEEDHTSITKFFNKTIDKIPHNLPQNEQQLLENNSNNVDLYFGKSRLHHLSTLKNYFKRICLTNFTQKCIEKCVVTKMIAHFDMDCFFVAASVSKTPDLLNKPLAVTHAKNQDVRSTSNIASCNYIARQYGLKNGMFVKTAYELCPELICVPYNFDMIKEIADIFFQVLCNEFTLVYPLSCDEALVDITNDLQANNIENKISTIRKLVYDRTNCHCSVGCSSSSILCRYLLKMAKPNGQKILYHHENVNFIENLSIEKLPVIDGKNIDLLTNIGLETYKDIKCVCFATIEKAIGNKLATKIVQFSNGEIDRDDQNLVQRLTTQKKSVSVNYNFGIRFTTICELNHLLESLSKELYSRMLDDEIYPISIILKLMIRKPNAPIQTYKHGGHGLCNILSSSCRFTPYDLKSLSSDIILKKSQTIASQIKFDIADLRGVSLTLKNKIQSAINSNSSLKKNNVSTSSIQSFFNPRNSHSVNNTLKHINTLLSVNLRQFHWTIHLVIINSHSSN